MYNAKLIFTSCFYYALFVICIVKIIYSQALFLLQQICFYLIKFVLVNNDKNKKMIKLLFQKVLYDLHI